ncbi:hypothetical protein [Pseudomonas sp. PDM11]|uniref:hypothetical protein n=1 Tax=Pseudomonas sp. PDM11 TaxID=2769309 RepID=UPI00178116C2|nr:hypothetical protein [Pseudomonas sp. PDM11]MBD9399108.1 hypothetical protein [Pseudomonas sp. PDM11]
MSVHVPSIDAALSAEGVAYDVYAVLTERIKECAYEYIARHKRRTHPAGGFDSAGRFTLSKRYDCCAGIRSPSRAFPYSENTHGRSLCHVAHEFGLARYESILRKVVNRINKIGEAEADAFLKSKSVKRKVLEADLGF